MSTKYEIIADLARNRVVEEMCCNVAHVSTLTDDLKDLAQIIYVALLEYPDALLIDLSKDSAIRFFIARMIINQWNTDHSPFRDLVTHFRSITDELQPNEDTTED